MEDVVVIGAGPGGYVAALAAAKAGLKVTVFEKEHLGGVCLNWGCIPTKALLKAAEHVSNLKHAANWGIEISSYIVNLEKIIEQSRGTVEKLTKGIDGLFKKAGVKWEKGIANIRNIESDSIEIECNGKVTETKHVIIATGSNQRSFPGVEFSARIWDTRKSMTPDFLPKKLAIIGAGAIGLEFGNFYAALGSEVKIFEATKEFLPMVDSEISDLLKKSLIKSGVEIFVDTTITSIKDCKEYVEIKIENETSKFDAVIIAIGVIPNIAGFEKYVSLEKNYIKTNQNHETNIKNIFAIGDCTAGPWLAHKAMSEGMRVVEYILSDREEDLDEMKPVPSCIYTNPQVAYIGIDEKNSKEKVKIGRYNLSGNGKALAMQENYGLIKVIFSESTGELLGAHMIGPEVTELIHSVSLGMSIEAVEEDWFKAIFPHPTISEALQEAILHAFGKGVH